MKQSARPRFSLVTLIATICMSTLCPAQSEHVLHAFHLSDGAFPQGVLIADSQQNLYGTTEGGGTGNCVFNGFPSCGTVFEFSRRGGGWAETVLHSFQGDDGAFPVAGLVADGAGNLYGTTSKGGQGGCAGYGCGTIFQLTPPLAPGGAWAFSVLYSFTGKSDGALPQGSLIFDNAGNLFGTASSGGKKYGVVFELSPPVGGGAWTETTLHQFDPSLGDGANPEAALVFDGSGNLYGTTNQGGVGVGTVFRLKPPAEPGDNWTERMLYAFKQYDNDGQSPSSTLILYRGSLVGTTLAGGRYGQGTVFQLTRLFGEALETNLYDFLNTGEDVNHVNGTLAVDSAQNIYGSATGGNNLGGVFELMPPAAQGDPWTEKVLFFFDDWTDGALPAGGLLIKDGWLLGATSRGGSSPLCNDSYLGCGTVFAIGR